MNNNKVKVSVIIPVWNMEKYLKKCLFSIERQTLKDIEIICINNGSIDTSLDIINEFIKKDKRFKVINIEHCYLSDARNIGTEYASGEYLYFCDADDFLEISALEKLYSKSKKHNADLCILQKKRWNEQTKKFMNIEHRLLKLYGCLEDRTYNYNEMKNIFLPRFEAWLHFYKRDFFISNKLYYPSKTFYEDVIIHFKSIFLAKRIVFYFEPLYTWRYRVNSTSSTSYNSKLKLDSIVYLKAIYYFLKEQNLLQEKVNDFIPFLLSQIEYHIKTAPEDLKDILINSFFNFIEKEKCLKRNIYKDKKLKTTYKNIVNNRLRFNLLCFNLAFDFSIFNKKKNKL